MVLFFAVETGPVVFGTAETGFWPVETGTPGRSVLAAGPGFEVGVGAATGFDRDPPGAGVLAEA